MKLFVPMCAAVILSSGLTVGSAEAGPLTGTWRGNGQLVLNSGGKERFRCKVSYKKRTFKDYAMNATCASTSAKIRQSTTISKIGKDRYVGSAYSKQYGITVTISVKVNGASQSVTLTSSAGRGSINLRRR